MDTMDVVEVGLRDFLSSAEVVVYEERILAAKPLTYMELGRRLHLSFQRIHQLEKRIRAKIEAFRQNRCIKKTRETYKWTFEACLEDAKKYGNQASWARYSPKAYTAAKRYGYLRDMVFKKELMLISTYWFNRPVDWTMERCLKDAMKYKNDKEWRLSSPTVYSVVHKKKYHQMEEFRGALLAMNANWYQRVHKKYRIVSLSSGG